MALFDSPNDIQWQGQIDSIKRNGTQVYVGKILDERGDGNYLDNMFQKYTIELMGWGQKVYNAKPVIEEGGYNGTGTYRTFKVNDVVLVQAKEGQLDEAYIIGSTRLNGDFQKLEVEGQGQIHGNHYTGPRQRVAPSNPPAIHPARACKVDGNFFIGGVNNAKDSYQDPTQLGDLEDSLDKQPIPGLLEYRTKEGVSVQYAYGGILQMTDGNLVMLSSGSRQNKCTKYLEQAERHAKIAGHIRNLGLFKSTVNITSQELLAGKDLEDPEVDLDSPIGEDGPISVTNATPYYNSSTGVPVSIPKQEEDLRETAEGQSRTTNTGDSERKNQQDSKSDEEEGVFNIARSALRYGVNILSGAEFRARKHEELAEIARAQADECNAIGAAYQYSSLLMGNSAGRAVSTIGASAPSQGIGHVDPNNYSSRNTGNPKPPTVSKPAHPTNYSNKKHKIQFLVLHHSAGTMESMTRSFQSPNYKASAQYGVDRDGTVVQFVPDTTVAFHVAGQNTGKIGIEIVATQPNHGMTSEQEDSLIKLCRYIVSTYNIPLANIRGHNEFMSTECPTWVFPTKQSIRDWVNKYLSDLGS